MTGGRRGGLGGSNPDRSGSWRHSGRDLAAEAAKGSPKTREGTERRRARGATHTMVRRTGAQKIIENVIYFEHLQNECFLVPNQGAPNVTHSEDFEHERLEAHQVANVSLPKLQVKQNNG